MLSIKSFLKPSVKKIGSFSESVRRVLAGYENTVPAISTEALWHSECISKEPMAVFWKKFRLVRRTVYAIQYMIPCVRVTFFSRQGLISKEGRILIWGKFRRLFISFFPSYAHYLQKKYGFTGGCKSCGASCKLLLQCPHWDEKSSLCSIYEDRPSVCRLFPITPADIQDRDLVNKKEPCGFTFQKNKSNS